MVQLLQGFEPRTSDMSVKGHIHTTMKVVDAQTHLVLQVDIASRSLGGTWRCRSAAAVQRGGAAWCHACRWCWEERQLPPRSLQCPGGPWLQHTIKLFLHPGKRATKWVGKLRFVNFTIYGWWLLEEGTPRNVPIAGFEMILREDYKSRDEVEGLIFFPKYHFKPQDTGNIPWCSRQQSRHLLYCMATHCPHCLARLRHSSQKFTKLSIFSAGIFFKLCAAQCVSIVLCAAVQRVSIVLCAQ